MSDPDSVAADWREELTAELVEAIERAIEQFHADGAYELRHGKLADTLRHLEAVETHSRGLLEAIGALSPVGMAAIHDEGMRRGIVTGRYELGAAASTLKGVPDIAAAAAELLRSMHSPMPDEGQGAGSALGRDSDLRAIAALHGHRAALAFRSPKDKFGVSVLKAFLRQSRDFDVSGRGAGKCLDTLLDRIWQEVQPGASANWKRVVHARRAIADLVERNLEAENVWRRAQAQENASSAKLERQPLKKLP